MSPVALGKLLVDRGQEVIVQMTCRDRNRLALQSDLLGASALGIRNICVMTGDHPIKGDHPGTKPVYDLDSVQLLSLIRSMGEGFDLAGNELEGSPDFVTGVVSNIDPSQFMQILKLEKKVSMGADFIQTQAVYDLGHFEQFLDNISHMEVPVLAGVIPLKSARMARFMNKNVPGIKVGDELIGRMERAEDPSNEGLIICAEQIKQLRKMCRGIHLMPIGHHRYTPQLLEMAGISTRK
jgi:5,10-methylenetetrahydrofolate reductase